MAFLIPILEEAIVVAGAAGILSEAPAVLRSIGQAVGVVSTVAQSVDAVVGTAKGLLATDTKVVSEEERMRLKRKAPSMQYWTCSESGDYMREQLKKKEGVIVPPIERPMDKTDYSKKCMDMVEPTHGVSSSISSSISNLGDHKDTVSDAISEHQPSSVQQKQLVSAAHKDEGNDIDARLVHQKSHRDEPFKVVSIKNEDIEKPAKVDIPSVSNAPEGEARSSILA